MLLAACAAALLAPVVAALPRPAASWRATLLALFWVAGAALPLTFTLCQSGGAATAAFPRLSCPSGPSARLVAGALQRGAASASFLSALLLLQQLPSSVQVACVLASVTAIEACQAVVLARYRGGGGAVWHEAATPLTWLGLAGVVADQSHMLHVLLNLSLAAALPLATAALARRPRGTATARGGAAAQASSGQCAEPGDSVELAAGARPGAAAGRRSMPRSSSAGSSATSVHDSVCSVVNALGCAASPTRGADRGDGASTPPASAAAARVLHADAGAVTAAAALLAALQARHASVVEAEASSVRYVSRVPRRANLLVKVALKEGGDTTYAQLEADMPAIIQDVVSQAGVVAQQQPPPAVLSYVGFRGCHQMVVQVTGLSDAGAALVAAALPSRIPAGARLVSVGAVPGDAEGPDASGVWVQPPTPAPGDAAIVVLPRALVQRLAADGAGLRVVVAAEAASGRAAVDLTLREGDRGWPADGELRVQLPRSCQGPMALVTLLRAAPIPRTIAEHDTYIATLPLLLLPADARAEVAGLWTRMVRARLQKGVPLLEAAAADAFQREWRPFAADFGVLAGRPDVALASAVGPELQAYLSAAHMPACARLLTCAGAATAATPAASTTAGAADLPALSALTVFWGYPSRAAEAAFQSWKAKSLERMDFWVLSSMLVQVAGFYQAVDRLAEGRGASPGEARHLRVSFLVHAGIHLLPGVAFALVRRMYLRWRGALWVGSTLLHAAVTAVEGGALVTQELKAVLQRPALYALVLHVVHPLSQRLTPWQQVLASVGQLAETRILLHEFLSPLTWMCILPCGPVLAALLDWRLRHLHRQELRPAAAAEAAASVKTAGSGGKGEGSEDGDGASSSAGERSG